MIRRLLLITTMILCVASVASAQYSTTTRSSYASSAPAHKADIILLGGYAWTMAMDVYAGLVPGEIDMDDAGFWGIAVDVDMAPKAYKTAQLRLLYRRQDANVTFRSVSGSGSTDAALEYWQIGGLGGVKRGNALPFGSVTLGGTRLIAGSEDDWKFSMIFGLGVKVYASPKIGFMIQGNWPITFTDTWGGVTVGTGGAGVAIGGTGISQLDLGGGLIFSF